MSKSSKQRRSDDEFKPPSAKKSKHQVKPADEHTSVQRIRLLDLIKCNYLSAGEEVFVKEQEGVITDRGTIKVLSSSGYIEYSNPTSWTKQVTGRENGGWGQIRLKSSKQTLSSIKELYQKNVSTMDFIDDDTVPKQLGFSSDSTLNTSTASSASPTTTSTTDTAPSDLTLPLKVRFINDEDRVFKIIWVSPDFKEFHTEYQGQLYSNLADFVNKIFEDFQKPSNDPNAPPPGNLRFDELMYELSPGKWVRLAGHLFPSDLMAQQGQQSADQVSYQGTLNQPHILAPPISFANSTPTGDNCNHKLNHTNNNTCNNTSTASVDDATHTNTSYDDYPVVDDDDDDDDDDYYANNTSNTNNDSRRRRSLNKNRVHHHYHTGGRRGGQPPCYKCLVYVEDSVYPIRVNSFGATSVRDVLHAVFTECSLKHNSASEVDILRDYSVEIEDQDFGGVKVAFPRSIASFPTKCKIFVRRKEQLETVVDNTAEKQEVSEASTVQESAETTTSLKGEEDE
eukprot:Phypoly_transcript_07425.p1 GENE.Phypoly_transcript_07425~~Phypoly_transcript_07425.p1  ORF type:complete len:533 (+),score=75.67 Phypoly_transcript_07425:71-1600(+)